MDFGLSRTEVHCRDHEAEKASFLTPNSPPQALLWKRWTRVNFITKVSKKYTLSPPSGEVGGTVFLSLKAIPQDVVNPIQAPQSSTICKWTQTLFWDLFWFHSLTVIIQSCTPRDNRRCLQGPRDLPIGNGTFEGGFSREFDPLSFNGGRLVEWPHYCTKVNSHDFWKCWIPHWQRRKTD